MSPDMLDRLTQARERSDLLSDWENGFVESLASQYDKLSNLSPRQVEIFERIESQKLSTSAQEARQQWNEQYDNKKRRTARICAQYYLSIGYFTNLATNVLEKPGFIPSEKAWKKMCENKYAKKVLETHDAAPKYEVGSLVTFRTTADWAHRVTAGDKPCVVITVGTLVRSAAKGAKPYEVLPFGAQKTILCEERHLKVYRKSKKAKKPTTESNDVPF